MLNTKADYIVKIDALNRLIDAESSAESSNLLPIYLAKRDILTIKLNTNRAQRRSQYKKIFVGKK